MKYIIGKKEKEDIIIIKFVAKQLVHDSNILQSGPHRQDPDN